MFSLNQELIISKQVRHGLSIKHDTNEPRVVPPFRKNLSLNIPVVVE
jgi:hypothetical protein